MSKPLSDERLTQIRGRLANLAPARCGASEGDDDVSKRIQPVPRWFFNFSNGDALDVEYGTGHWSQILNMETGQVTGSIYVYDATYIRADHSMRQTAIPRKHLLTLRRLADSNGVVAVKD